MFKSMFNGWTDPKEAIQKGKFAPSEDDIVLEPQKDKFGSTIYGMPKDLNVEIQEMISLFNSSSPEAQTVFIQKIVKNYPDEVVEFLKELKRA